MNSTTTNQLSFSSPASRPQKGFTLVEVVLALGLCSFALISLVSLMPVSLGMAKNAVETTRRAKVIQHVVSELSQSRFTNVTAPASKVIERTFDYDGIPTTASNSIYFTVSATVEPGTTLPGAEDASLSLARVKLEVKTPSQTMAETTSATISDMGY